MRWWGFHVLIWFPFYIVDRNVSMCQTYSQLIPLQVVKEVLNDSVCCLTFMNSWKFLKKRSSDQFFCKEVCWSFLHLGICTNHHPKLEFCIVLFTTRLVKPNKQFGWDQKLYTWRIRVQNLCFLSSTSSASADLKAWGSIAQRCGVHWSCLMRSKKVRKLPEDDIQNKLSFSNLSKLRNSRTVFFSCRKEIVCQPKTTFPQMKCNLVTKMGPDFQHLEA